MSCPDCTVFITVITVLSRLLLYSYNEVSVSKRVLAVLNLSLSLPSFSSRQIQPVKLLSVIQYTLVAAVPAFSNSLSLETTILGNFDRFPIGALPRLTPFKVPAACKYNNTIEKESHALYVYYCDHTIQPFGRISSTPSPDLLTQTASVTFTMVPSLRHSCNLENSCPYQRILGYYSTLMASKYSSLRNVCFG